MKKITLLNNNNLLQHLKSTFILIIFIICFSNGLLAQEELRVVWQNGIKWPQYTDSHNSLYKHLANQVYDLLEIRQNEVSKLRTLSDWQQRQNYLKKTFAEIAGPFPERNNLNAKTLNVINKEKFKVEHIVFESQPGFFVTSSVFIPKKSNNIKLPVIIYCSGHSIQGYHTQGAQKMILNLVEKGFMVFAFDPVGQGERIEYLDPLTGQSILGGPTKEHSYPGTQAIISGSSQAKYMIWDGIRAVDYLLTRKDVDPAKIGITGCSGGGTQSACIAALDDRIYAAVPQCYITSYKRLFQSRGPQDAEQNLFHGILRGIDHADLLSVRAPKPALVLSTTEDFFSIQGARETVSEVSLIYKAFDKLDNFYMVEDMGPHGSTKKTREAMYAFFQKHLNNPGTSYETEVEPLTDDEIRVTPTGQLSTSIKSETVYSLNLKETNKLIAQLDISRNDLEKHIPNVLNSAIKLSGYNKPNRVDPPVFTGQIKREGYTIEKYFMEGEGDYIIPYLLTVPEKPNGKAIIYLHPEGKDINALEKGEIEWFTLNGFAVLAPDMLGIGEVGPGDFKGDAYIDGFSHNIWYASMLIGRSVVGIRTSDIVRLTMSIKNHIEINEIYGIAIKEMAPVLLHAAAFEPSISKISLIEPYSSYRSIVQNRFYNSAFIHSTVPGALKDYDLPDLAAALAPRKLLIAGTTDGNSKTNTEEIDKDLEVIKTAYQNKKSNRQLEIVSVENLKNPLKLYAKWLKE